MGPLRNASYVAPGHFRFVFYPTTSGWTSLGASFTGQAITVTPASILVHPASISGYASTSLCRKTMGITKCNVKHRDDFGNVVSACSSYTTDTSLQPLGTCHTLS